MGLKSYIAKKILFAAVAYFVAVSLVFFLYHALPGSPANVFAMDPRVPPDVRDQLLTRWGLNEPLWKQYFIFLGNLLQGDLGFSFLHKKPVSDVIDELVSGLRNKLGFGDVALNLVSGTGKEHMALLSALIKIGVGIRFVAYTRKGVCEI